jgi:uncharacterized membrane protein HdeD (DUF308 family)
VWWWFLVQGGLIALWGGFALVSPIAGAPGWILDGTTYGIILLLGGVLLLLQSWGARRTGTGWLGLALGGLMALLAGLGCLIAGGLGNAVALFWVIVVFLVIEGTVFIAGTVRDPIYRVWGLLMGGIILLAVATLLGVHFVFGGDFDVLDPVLGSLGLLYGIALIVAAIQVRDRGISRAAQEA